MDDKSKSLKRLLTGIRPTGPLHLGHYVGALKQWIPLQDEYECFFLIADIQALTTHAENPGLIVQAVEDVVLDWVSVGLDPTRSNVHFVLQSEVRELTELTVYLGMVTPFTWMERNPTIREERKHLKKSATVGFMTYVVSQAADILFVSHDPNQVKSSILVPVGEDQAPHLRDNNRIASAFNKLYGPTFNRCNALIGDVGRLVGVDGQAKMSKSAGNAINLKDDPETVKNLVMGMFTDPKRTSADVPGTVEDNPVFIYHDAFNTNVEEVADLKDRYKKGKVGDVEVKKKLIVALESFLEPIRARRADAKKNLDTMDVLSSGTARARELAAATVERTRSAMHLMRLP
ncbi:tryptophan--tRNA ligase [candidate division WWE3 bacterium RIFCSPHIGHO2_01_FULL_42_13]|uniref:Tryptophan--tRNA ligase n=1 Tax=candidate division WWE3 bacterium RIFCSPHIGHO2_01_FULL_42_13 TaxID=1802617 RepID=A0A1F4URW1_UNCKA|nr:MAG: tryptophan--tRNA ligase [candidate division WWE3 bacterium RIFCSPHIGHO2_01_FULL_42_13]